MLRLSDTCRLHRAGLCPRPSTRENEYWQRNIRNVEPDKQKVLKLDCRVSQLIISSCSPKSRYCFCFPCTKRMRLYTRVQLGNRPVKWVVTCRSFLCETNLITGLHRHQRSSIRHGILKLHHVDQWWSYRIHFKRRLGLDPGYRLRCGGFQYDDLVRPRAQLELRDQLWGCPLES